MKHNPSIEKQFKRRYNRDVEVYRKIYQDNGQPKKAEVEINFKGNKFLLTEHLKDGLTDYTTVEEKGRMHKYKTHLEAECFVADKIGEIENA
jgi:hypothetical protein